MIGSAHKKYSNQTLITCVMLLVGIGLIMITSTTAHLVKDNSLYYLIKQVAVLSAACVLGFVIISFIPQPKLLNNRKLVGLFYIAAIILLILPLVGFIGVEHYGAKRWIRLPFGFEFQTSELAKVFLIISMAIYFQISLAYEKNYAIKSNTYLQNVFSFAKSWIWFFIPAVLIILQKDFGSLITMLAIWLCLQYIYSYSMRVVGIFIPVVILLLVLLVVTEPYRMKRVKDFLLPFTNVENQLFKNADDSAYQTIQSKIALAEGGILGVGSGTGMQKLYHLPKAHNDFIFSTIGEEYGLLGIILLIMLYFILIKNLFYDAHEMAKNNSIFSAVLHTSFALWIFFLLILHAGSCIGLLPPKGTTLPFISYGGSNLMSLIILLSFVLAVRK